MVRIGVLIFLVAATVSLPLPQAHADSIPMVTVVCSGCADYSALLVRAQNYFQQWQFNTPPGFPAGSAVDPAYWCDVDGFGVMTCSPLSETPTNAYVYSDTYPISGTFVFDQDIDGSAVCR